MRLARAFACLIAVACARETSERPPPSRAPSAHPRLPLPLPETAFEESATAPPPRSARASVSVPAPSSARAYAGGLIDLDVNGAGVHDVLRLLADVGRVSIVVAGDITGTVTLKLKRVRWDHALDVVAESKNLAVERDGNVIVVRARQGD